MWRIRRKPKIPQLLDEKSMRGIIQEELETHDAIAHAKNEKERERQIKLAKLKGMSKSQRNRFLRYVKERREKNVKK